MKDYELRRAIRQNACFFADGPVTARQIADLIDFMACYILAYTFPLNSDLAQLVLPHAWDHQPVAIALEPTPIPVYAWLDSELSPYIRIDRVMVKPDRIHAASGCLSCYLEYAKPDNLPYLLLWPNARNRAKRSQFAINGWIDIRRASGLQYGHGSTQH